MTSYPPDWPGEYWLQQKHTPERACLTAQVPLDALHGQALLEKLKQEEAHTRWLLENTSGEDARLVLQQAWQLKKNSIETAWRHTQYSRAHLRVLEWQCHLQTRAYFKSQHNPHHDAQTNWLEAEQELIQFLS